MGSNIVNSCNAHRERFSKCFSVLGRVSSSDFKNFIRGKFCFPLTFSESHPPLVHRIFNVLLLGSKKKMVRVKASTVVALVTNENPIRNFPKREFPRHSVSSLPLPIASHEFTVTVLPHHPRPNPARFGFHDSFKENLFYWWRGAEFGAEFLLRPFCLEFFSTTRTMFLDHTKLVLSMVREGINSVGALYFFNLRKFQSA